MLVSYKSLASLIFGLSHKRDALAAIAPVTPTGVSTVLRALLEPIAEPRSHWFAAILARPVKWPFVIFAYAARITARSTRHAPDLS